MVLNYIKSRAVFVIIFAVCCGVFAVVFAGYSLPTAAVLYALAICFSVIFVAFIVDFILFSRKVKRLRQCKNEITLTIENLPAAANFIEKEYSEMLEILFDEKTVIKKGTEQKLADLSDYYTVWAHQI